jgi:RNA polymerase sigma-70 factor (ECF subfamily)
MTRPSPSERLASDPTSLSLLARVKARDEDAWSRLVDLYGPLVYAWSLRAGLQPEDAADIGQDVFTAVTRNIEKFRRESARDSFRAWLFTITRHKICDFLSRRGARAAGGSDALQQLAAAAVTQTSDLQDDAAPGEAAALYRRAIELVRAEFAPRTWMAFWRVAVDGERPADVATALGMTVNAVYLARSHVKHRLREEFAELLELDE